MPGRAGSWPWYSPPRGGSTRPSPSWTWPSAWSRPSGESSEKQRALADEALEMARQATARFPLHARLWLDLARVYQVRKEEGEVEALRNALRINPGWGPAVRQLSEVYERTGRLQ